MQSTQLMRLFSPQPGESAAEALIRHKLNEYVRGAKVNRALYYALRLLAGVSAALLPFVISSYPAIATGLSICVVVVTVIDLIFNPKDRWKLYSQGSDLLTIFLLKKTGDYKAYKEAIDVLLKTENIKLDRLVDMKELIDSAQERPSQQ